MSEASAGVLMGGFKVTQILSHRHQLAFNIEPQFGQYGPMLAVNYLF